MVSVRSSLDGIDTVPAVNWAEQLLTQVHSPGAISRLPSVLDLIEMVEIDPAVRIAARTVAAASVRSLDGIHLATAVRLGEQLTSFVTYDKRLAEAAAGAGLRVDMPVQ